MASPPTFIDWLDRLSTSWMRGPVASGWYGVTLALQANEAVESWLLACRMHLLDDPESPDDVLPIIAQDRQLPRYPLETADQHRTRLIDAWNIYQEAGTEEVIEKQILAAGYGPTEFLGEWGNPNVTFGDPTYVWADRGAYVEFRPNEPGPRGEAAPYASQFWIVFATGFHPITGLPNPWGSWTWGDTEPLVHGVWTYYGYTPDFQRTILGIVKKWKPCDHVFRGMTFMISNIPWGDVSTSWGDATVLWGGALSVDVPLS